MAGMWQISDDTLVIKSEPDLMQTEQEETFSNDQKETLAIKNETPVPVCIVKVQENSDISCISGTLDLDQGLCGPLMQNLETRGSGVKLEVNSEDITSAIKNEPYISSDEAMGWGSAVKQEDYTSEIEHNHQTEVQDIFEKSEPKFLKRKRSVVKTELDTSEVRSINVDEPEDSSDLEDSTVGQKKAREELMPVFSIQTGRLGNQRDLECPSQTPGAATASFSICSQEHHPIPTDTVDKGRASTGHLTTEILDSIFILDSEEEAEVLQQISNLDSNFDENGEESHATIPATLQMAYSVDEDTVCETLICDGSDINDDDDEVIKILDGRGDKKPCLVHDLPEDVIGEVLGEYKRGWSKDLTGFPPQLTFSASPGLQGPLQLPPWDECEPVDFFRLFIDSETIEAFKRETNRYADQVIDAERNSSNPIQPNPMLNTWQPVTLNEMTNFLSVLIYMAVVHKPRMRDYWSKIPVMDSPFPSNIMSHDRFMQILSFFHLNDNSTYITKGLPGHDPLHKIRPLADHLNHVFQTVYIPEQQISIDDTVWHRKESPNFRIYLKDKCAKRTIKVFKLCESTSGYVWKFEITCSLFEVSNKHVDVINRLIDPLKSLGYCLYVDSYNCSPQIAESLVAANTGLVGTIKGYATGVPNEFLKKQVWESKYVDFLRCKSMVALRWKDKKDVSIISTIHKPQMVTVKTRGEVIKKPTAFIDFDKYKASADQSTRIVSYTPLYSKPLKWWKKLAFHLLSLTVVQAHCLYNKLRKQLGKPGMQWDDFVISVAQSLATYPSTEDPLSPAYPVGSEMSRLNAKHFGHFLVSAPRRQCVVCNKRMRAAGADEITLQNECAHSLYECEACKMSLCVEPCFKLFHTEIDFTA